MAAATGATAQETSSNSSQELCGLMNSSTAEGAVMASPIDSMARPGRLK